MFTAITIKKDFRNGIFQVTVNFADGSETITEAFNVNSESELNNRIENRLNTLNELKTLATNLVLGAWTKPDEPIDELSELEIVTKKLYELKNLATLGVTKETDPEYLDAITAYKQVVSTK